MPQVPIHIINPIIFKMKLKAISECFQNNYVLVWTDTHPEHMRYNQTKIHHQNKQNNSRTKQPPTPTKEENHKNKTNQERTETTPTKEKGSADKKEHRLQQKKQNWGDWWNQLHLAQNGQQ